MLFYCLFHYMEWLCRDTSTSSVLNVSGMPLCRWRSENTGTFVYCWWIDCGIHFYLRFSKLQFIDQSVFCEPGLE